MFAATSIQQVTFAIALLGPLGLSAAFAQVAQDPGADVILFKEQNLRIHFRNTGPSGVPTRDWRLLFNDSQSQTGQTGPVNYFGIEDATVGRRVFTLEAGAPAHSLFVDDKGRVGFGTPDPRATLHASGQSPTLRFEHRGTTPKIWELGGNGTDFRIKDGGRTTVRIQSGAPANSLILSRDGGIGVGTVTPSRVSGGVATGTNLNVTGTARARLTAQSPGGSELNLVDLNAPSRTRHFRILSDGGRAVMSSVSDDLVNNRLPFLMTFDLSSGAVGINSPNPTGLPLVVGQESSLVSGNGAHLTRGGLWINAVNRSVATSIAPLPASEARAALRGLNPVKFRFRNSTSEEAIGVMGDTLPALVSTTDRRGVSALEIATLAAAVTKDQQRLIDDYDDRITQLEDQLDDQEQRITQLETNLRQLQVTVNRQNTLINRQNTLISQILTRLNACGCNVNVAATVTPMADVAPTPIKAPVFGPLNLQAADDPIRWFSAPATVPVAGPPAAGPPSVDDSAAWRLRLADRRDQGLPVVAVVSGTVVSLQQAIGSDAPRYPASWSDRRGEVLVDHGGFFAGYQNLSEITVRSGDKVFAGQELGVIPDSEASGANGFVFAIYEKKGERLVSTRSIPFEPREFFLGLPRLLQLSPGGNHQVSARVPFFADRYTINDSYYDDATLWSSDDPGVAAVDARGRVTAVAAGRTKLRLRFSGEEHLIPVNVD